MLNGDGLRVVLWVAGCNHHCKGCQNPITWDPNGGIPFDDEAKHELFSELAKPHIAGITLSGGDPLHPNNINTIKGLIISAKSMFPNKTVWLYTGYGWDWVSKLDFIQLIDVVVDGEFVEDLKDNRIHWCGSSNQHVIDVKASLSSHVIIPHK